MILAVEHGNHLPSRTRPDLEYCRVDLHRQHFEGLPAKVRHRLDTLETRLGQALEVDDIAVAVDCSVQTVETWGRVSGGRPGSPGHPRFLGSLLYAHRQSMVNVHELGLALAPYLQTHR